MADRFSTQGLNPPPLETRWTNNDTLGDKLEKALTRFIQRVITWGWKFIANLLVEIFDQSMKIMKPGTARATDAIFNHFKTIPDLPEWFKSTMAAVEKEEGESSFLLRLAVFVLGIRMIIFGGMRPLENLATYNADKAARSYLPDVMTTVSLWRAGIMTEAGAKDTLAKLGVSDMLHQTLYQYARNLPNLGDVIAGRWRGIIPDAEWPYLLKRMGYEQSDIELYTELSKNIPPLSDLIRMMVREAWNDPTASKFGYDDDYPNELNEWLRKQGYDPEWGKRYWRSHWDLPSPTQAYEMLHRGLIDKGTLSELLKTADYPSFWREKLEAISYNVLTRVDVRRLVMAGLMDEARALKTYKDMGYTEEDAKLLVQFAIQGISQDEKDLTKAEVVGMYIDGIADRSATAGALVKMGYDAQEAESILKMADLDIVKAARTDAINATHEKFIAGKLDEAGVTADLMKAGLKTNGIDRYLLRWRREKEAAVRIPTIAEAKRFYIGDIITEQDFRDNLTANGVAAKYQDWFIKEAKLGRGE